MRYWIIVTPKKKKIHWAYRNFMPEETVLQWLLTFRTQRNKEIIEWLYRELKTFTLLCTLWELHVLDQHHHIWSIKNVKGIFQVQDHCYTWQILSILSQLRKNFGMKNKQLIPTLKVGKLQRDKGSQIHRTATKTVNTVHLASKQPFYHFSQNQFQRSWQ